MNNPQEIMTQLKATITVLTADLIATPNILEVVQWAKVHKQQMENAKKVYEEACKIIKVYMQSAETLISPDGARLATYKQNKSYMTLDKEAFKLNFADVYDVCLIEHKGNRPFELT
jgi:hypothetical protein